LAPQIDRLNIRNRPAGHPLMHQAWGKLLFMHWRINPALLRPIIPGKLEIDTYDGSAWLAVVPFTMWDIRGFPPYMPRVPGFNAMHELNVRTYVHYNGVPGVWFFSLDCNREAAVLAARTFYYLPYFKAHIDLDQDGQVITYECQRLEAPAARFIGRWEIGDNLPTSETESLEFFLTERYCLYSEHRGEIYRSRVFHQPWALQRAEIHNCESSMIESLGLTVPAEEPLLHYAEELSVEIWKLEKV
jgi:uncharacterized protein YqjF (DUF2071 family)